MKNLFLALFISSGFCCAAQPDSSHLGKWQLFKIIDNMTGDEIIPPKPNADFEFYIVFQDSTVGFNLEINKCGNSYSINGLNQIEFLYYDDCTQICCDKEFSALLTYEACTGYYIRGNTLVMVSEERIFYFSRVID